MVPNNIAKPPCRVSIISWTEQKFIQHWFKPAASSRLSPYDYVASCALKRAIGGQQQSIIALFREALRGGITHGNASGGYKAV